MQTQPFGVTISDRTIRVHGELDLAVAEHLVEAIARVAESTSQPTVVVDMGWTTFIDSEGLGALIEARRALDEMGKDLVLHNVPTSSHKVMVTCGLVDVLNVRSTAS